MNSLTTSLHDQGELGKAASMNREVLEKREEDPRKFAWRSGQCQIQRASIVYVC
jgi:hypothetical protein